MHEPCCKADAMTVDADTVAESTATEVTEPEDTVTETLKTPYPWSTAQMTEIPEACGTTCTTAATVEEPITVIRMSAEAGIEAWQRTNDRFCLFNTNHTFHMATRIHETN